MIQFSELNLIPFIGQTVHFHPDAHTRLAAIVVEVHPIQRDDQSIIRPAVDLQICNLNGKMQFQTEVPCFDDNGFVGCWSLINEMELIQLSSPEDDEELPGSKSNYHTGNQ